MLKKLISVILAFSFLFALSSCGDDTEASPLKESEFISSKVDDTTRLTYDEYEDYVIVTGINKTPDEIIIPETLGGKEVKAISDGAFRSMGWVLEISVPDTVVSIGESAFYGSVSCKKISLSDNLYEIGAYAFYGAGKVEKIRLPLGLEIIGGYAFADCTKLEGISIPKGASFIGGGAFQNTKWLSEKKGEFIIEGDGVLVHYAGDKEKVTIPEEVKAVSGFSDSFFTKEVVLTKNVTAVCEYAFANSGVTKVLSGDKVETVGNNAFDSCLNLESVELGKKLTSIGHFAFAGCQKITDFTVTDKVKTVGDGAFARCENLETLIFSSKKTVIGENICESCNKNLRIVCPKDSQAVSYAKENGFVLDVE